MSEEKALTAIKEKFSGSFLDLFKKNDRRVYITVDKKDVPALCHFMYKDLGGRLAIATGLDSRSGVEILYHFMYPQDHQMITVKTKLNKSSLEIESISSFFESANWIEREMHDILGVNFIHHPDPRRILMADDWPEGDYPFRRDFKERQQ